MKGRVLIIDDEAEIRRNLTIGLTQEDYTAVACPDGISAIHELNRAREKGITYDYLVTDIFMPDIDGLKILKVIKNQYPDLPVLVITGFGDERLMVTALSEHNTGYLDKPFEIADLVAAREASGEAWNEFLRVPTLSMGVYALAAGAEDPQTPHDQDEVYYVVSGRGVLQVEDADRPVQAGSIVYVEANADHRFHSITEDLTTLVFFAPAES